jgi:hypothetical protein
MPIEVSVTYDAKRGYVASAPAAQVVLPPRCQEKAQSGAPTERGPPALTNAQYRCAHAGRVG